MMSIDTTDSRFEVLLGDVTLGQRGDLLQHAARPGEQVTVGVLEEETQTAIVEARAQIVLNFNHFWRQVSGRLPADQLTATLSRLLLNPSTGAPLTGSEEELSPSEGHRWMGSAAACSGWQSAGLLGAVPRLVSRSG